MIAEILRLVAVTEMLAQRDEQIAVVRLHNAATIVIAGRQRPFLPEDDRDVVEAAVGVVQPCPRHGGKAAATGTLGEAEIDRLVLGEAAVEHDVVQAALAGRRDLRHALQRRGQLAIRRCDPHAAGPLGHQQPGIRQEDQRPGIDQSACDGLNLKLSG